MNNKEFIENVKIKKKSTYLLNVNSQLIWKRKKSAEFQNVNNQLTFKM